MQRADLFEAIVADIYGAEPRWSSRASCRRGLVASSPEFLRPLAGVKPAGGHFLHFCAFELGRGPNGQWWVLGDRTQAPSGAGFALENRVATTRAFPTSMATCTCIGWPASSGVSATRCRPGARAPIGRVAILTPGPINETYFEHAYIARYLGFMLLEGEDLTVDGWPADGAHRVGLKPISVLWRRLDAAYADPLELDSASQDRHARHRRGAPRRLGHVGQRAWLRHPGDARVSRVPAEDCARAARRGTAAAVDRDLVVRPGGASASMSIDKLDRMMVGPASRRGCPSRTRRDRAWLDACRPSARRPARRIEARRRATWSARRP